MVIMQKHAIALGYFFLAVFCIYTATEVIRELQVWMALAALIATLAGFGYLLSAFGNQLKAGTSWFIKESRRPPQPLAGESNIGEEQTA